MTRREILAGAAALAAPGDIFTAVRANDVAAVERLVAADPALIAATAGGVTPLMAAAFLRRGPTFVRPEDSAVFQALAPRVTAPNIFEACLLKRTEAVKAALARDPALARAAARNGWTVLHFAAYVGDIAAIDLLLDAGADIDAPAAGAFLSPPLQTTLLGRRDSALEHLIARGAKVGFRMDDGSTPMHEAGLLGNDHAVRVLATAGVGAATPRTDGITPRDLALRHGHAGTAALLDALARAGG